MRKPFLFLLLFAFSAPCIAAASQVATYEGLLQAVRDTRAASEARITAAVEQERVREAWETGKLIDEHILLHKERAGYGERVIIKLAKDLGTSETELKYMLQFARTYSIRRPADELSWSHHQSLLAINDPKEREEVTKEAVEKGWSRDQVREEVSRRIAKNPEEIPAGPPRLKAQKGILDTYRIVKLEGRLVISLGFSNYLELSKKDARRFKEGDIVRVSRGKLERAKGATESLVPFQLFSYRARVLEITDGDTFWALVDLGFGITTKQQLRLRGLDAPEIEGADGKEAKAFLESVLAGPAPVMITSSRSDKYDRYLADVWARETYVNQELLDKGLAVAVRG